MMYVQCMLWQGVSMDMLWPHYGVGMHQAAALPLVPDKNPMPIFAYKNLIKC